MKSFTLICAMCIGTVLSAREIVVGQQTVSPFPDTEVSTNVAFKIDRKDVQTFDVQIGLNCSASNCVQIAFGRDADEDGLLSFDETEFVIGWRSGRVFIENVIGNVRYFDDLPVMPEEAQVLNMRVSNNRESLPKKVSFTHNAGSCFADVAAQCPDWLFSPNWNILKVTRRGIIPADELCRINRIFRSFHVIVK